MARRRHRQRTLPNERGRSPTASGQLDSTLDAILSRPLPRIRPMPVTSVRSQLSEVEDRRRFHPDRVKPVRSLRRHQVPVHLVTPNPKRPGLTPRASHARGVFSRMGFSAPKFVAVCIRRHERREVLFAKKRTGKGSRSPKRRGTLSHIRC